MTGNPDASPADFDRWAEAAGAAMRRYPELQDIGLVELVPASQLAGFEALHRGQPDPAPRPELAGAEGRLRRSCPRGAARTTASRSPGSHGRRDLHARRGRLLRAGAGADRRARLRPGHLRARSSTGRRTTLGVQTPVYRGGDMPATRRRAAAGLRGLARGAAGTTRSCSPGRSQAHPRLAVSFRYTSGGLEHRVHERRQAAARAEHDDRPAQRLDRADVRARPPAGRLSSWNALMLLIGGIAPERRGRPARARARHRARRARAGARVTARRTASSPTRPFTTPSPGCPTARWCSTVPSS